MTTPMPPTPSVSSTRYFSISTMPAGSLVTSRGLTVLSTLLPFRAVYDFVPGRVWLVAALLAMGCAPKDEGISPGPSASASAAVNARAPLDVLTDQAVGRALTAARRLEADL